MTGDTQGNIEHHKEFIKLAVVEEADVIFFPELSLTGYEPSLARELAITPDDPKLNCFQSIADSQQIIVGIGAPTASEVGILISILLFQPGKARTTYSKQYIHTDEEPVFTPGPKSAGLMGEKLPIAMAICYELSVAEHAEFAVQSGAIAYVACVAKAVKQVEKAHERLREIAVQYSMPVLVANSVGPLDGDVGGGKSSAWNSEGTLLGQLDGTEEAILVFDMNTQVVLQTRV